MTSLQYLDDREVEEEEKDDALVMFPIKTIEKSNVKDNNNIKVKDLAKNRFDLAKEKFEKWRRKF